jgi:cytochrome c556
MKSMFPLFSLCLFMAYPQAGAAHEDEGGDVERAIEYRQAVMTILGRNMKLMGAMMKNQLPYDQATFTRLAKDLDAAANLDLLAGFPSDSAGEDSDARPDIWLKMEDFEQKYKDLQSAAGALNQAVESGDQTKIKPVFFSLAKTCKDCHKAYRE